MFNAYGILILAKWAAPHVHVVENYKLKNFRHTFLWAMNVRCCTAGIHPTRMPLCELQHYPGHGNMSPA